MVLNSQALRLKRVAWNGKLLVISVGYNVTEENSLYLISMVP
jgi:hypothetical protein